MSDGKRTRPGIYVVILAGVACSVVVCGRVVAALLLPAIQAAREAARRHETVENLTALGDALKNSQTDADEATSQYVRCQGVLADYEEEYPWFENSTENGRDVHADGRSPRALFVISRPAKYAERKVGVLFMYSGDASATVPGSSDKGMTFSFEVPEDFLAGSYDTIGNDVIKNLSRIEP